MFRPYDTRSELVTAMEPETLEHRIHDFYEGSAIFDAFLDKKVLEKYIGPLDGKNLERNIEFIYRKIKA